MYNPVYKAIEWLVNATSAIEKDHRAFGKSAKDVEYLMEQHENIKVHLFAFVIFINCFYMNVLRIEYAS